MKNHRNDKRRITLPERIDIIERELAKREVFLGVRAVKIIMRHMAAHVRATTARKVRRER